MKKKETGVDVKDISGILGLLWGGSDAEGREKADIFERTVADVVLWHIESMPPAEIGITRVVLIQGPMIPKLRGRLQYRMPSKDCVICTLTYQREWLRRLEMSRFDLDRLDSLDTETAGFNIGEVFPPTAVDAGSRAWLGTMLGQPYQIEVITTTQSGPQSDWVPSIELRIGAMFREGQREDVNVGDQDVVELPTALAKATDACRDLMRKERKWLSLHAYLTKRDLYGKALVDFPANIGSILKPLEDVWRTADPVAEIQSEGSGEIIDILADQGFLKGVAAADRRVLKGVDEVRSILMDNPHVLEKFPEILPKK